MSGTWGWRKRLNAVAILLNAFVPSLAFALTTGVPRDVSPEFAGGQGDRGIDESGGFSEGDTRFEVKPTCSALKNGRCVLKELRCTNRFGIKIARIKGIDAEKGYYCWILPVLPNPAEIDAYYEATATAQLVKAYGDVYQVYSASAVHVQDSASGLRKFMNEFDLEDGDLSCDFLPAHPVAYTHPMAATICSKECAESLLQDLTKTGNIPHLRALNMRINFSISPVAVVHGGRGLCGSWELPETTETVLYPGDRLMFYVPAENEDQLLHNHCSKKLIEFKESQLGTHIAVVGRPMLAALRAAQSEPIFGAEPTETQPPLSSGQEIDQRQNGAQSTRPEQIQQSPHTQRGRGRGRGANPKRKTRRSRGVLKKLQRDLELEKEKQKKQDEEMATPWLYKVWSANGMEEGWASEHGKWLRFRAAPVSIPTLKFTVKKGCNALRDGHDDRCVLKELHSSSRFGIKIARISSIHNSERRTPRHEYVAYPDAEDELKAGYECWILPFLSELVELTDEDTATSQLVEAYAHIYRVDSKTGAVHVGSAESSGLRAFMERFDLTDSDLSCDCLLAHPVAYLHHRAASICTEPFAEALLLQLRKAYWSSSCPAALQSIFTCLGLWEDEKLGLRVMNMRNEFKISPLAVVHGGLGSLGLWELPESTKTILCPRDRLMFFLPSEADQVFYGVCKERLASLNDQVFLSGMCLVERSPADLFSMVTYRPSPPSECMEAKPKRKTRRGRGGMDSRKTLHFASRLISGCIEATKATEATAGRR
ncbi:Uncharacterized protein SCF082_LOCUS33937 [Durusdinium trenchii]|uniref:Uncharacterized protein n=1 Tax=Durusdinium trenchii TaxID=1381693 RepID=A0ABP0NSS9_9DINO